MAAYSAAPISSTAARSSDWDKWAEHLAVRLLQGGPVVVEFLPDPPIANRGMAQPFPPGDGDGLGVEGFHSQAKVIHVASAHGFRGRDEIHQGSASSKLDEPWLERFWGAAKDVTVEGQHPVEVHAS